MAERKAVNKYYPPDWDPSKGSVNKHVGQHPLRERAKKLSQGILVIRFEMPYNIWCGGCGNHIGMGVRYNAEKKKVGNYYTTPIYRFRMKCHLCDNYMEIETDPKNCDYTIVSGARRKEERWDPSATENVQATDHAEKQKLIDDAMFKLEHGEKDKRKSKAAIPGLVQIKDIQSQWKDDFALNQMLRKKFRQEKKVILEKEEKDQEIKDKGSLDIDLVNEDPEDIKLAKRIRFHSTGFQEDQRKRRLQIKARPMFSDKGTSSTNIQRASLLEKRQRILINKPDITSSMFPKNIESLGIIRKQNKDKVCSANVRHVNEINQAENDDERLLSAREMTVKLQDSGDICGKEAISGDSGDICEIEATSEDSGDICGIEATSEDSGDICEKEATSEDSENICGKEATSKDSGDICEKEAISEDSWDICGKEAISEDSGSICGEEAISEPEVGESETRSADSKIHTRAGCEVDFVSRTDSQAVKTDINNLHSKTSKQNISLISEMYSDTDSDSSK